MNTLIEEPRFLGIGAKEEKKRVQKKINELFKYECQGKYCTTRLPYIGKCAFCE